MEFGERKDEGGIWSVTRKEYKLRSLDLLMLKVFSLAKSEHHCSFAIEKKRRSLDNLRKFLHNLGFPSHATTLILSPLGDIDNNYSSKKYCSSLYEDEYFYLYNKEYKIDIFSGKNKIIVSIFTKSDKQNQITDNLFNLFAWYEKTPRAKKMP